MSDAPLSDEGRSRGPLSLNNAIRLRIENARAAVEAAMVDARRRVRMNKGDVGRR
jgi:hypothetical protein